MKVLDNKFRNLFLLLRPHHWIKNFLVFAPLFFSFSFNKGSIILASLAFVAYCLVASSIYVINDIFDADKDRHHREKKNRPIASGKVSIVQASILSVILFTLSLLVGFEINSHFVIIIIIYLIINILYSFRLKSYAIIDVMLIAFGFVLRVMAGSIAIGVITSHWLLLCTFFIALLFAFGKRKIEMHELGQGDRNNHRKSILEYTDGFIDQMLALSAGISVVFYSLYTIDLETVQRFGSDNLIYTTPVAVFGAFRYFHLLYNKKTGGDPVKIFMKDRQIVGAIIIWILMVISIYYKYPRIDLGF